MQRLSTEEQVKRVQQFISKLNVPLLNEHIKLDSEPKWKINSCFVHFYYHKKSALSLSSRDPNTISIFNNNIKELFIDNKIFNITPCYSIDDIDENLFHLYILLGESNSMIIDKICLGLIFQYLNNTQLHINNDGLIVYFVPRFNKNIWDDMLYE